MTRDQSLGRALPIDVAAAIGAWHEQAIGHDCVAHGEGQLCCIDLLLRDQFQLQEKP